MENCIYQPDGQGKFRCERCGLQVSNPLRTNCRASNTPNPPPHKAIEPPPLLTRLANFAVAAAAHAVKGNPTVPEEVMQERLAICRACPLFKVLDQEKNTGVCTHQSCGCTIQDNITYLNKIAWADQECPIGSWKKVSGV